MPATKSHPRKTPARKTTARKTSARKTAAPKASPRKWSAKVAETSDALDLKAHLFKSNDPHAIALSLKRSAERSRRRKGTPYQSAMSMLNFYINRGGKNLSAARKKKLEAAKGELRQAFGRA